MSKSITEDKSAKGILECVFDHAISETKVKFKYLGPRISPNDWHQVLSFFQWTYDTTKSESQVRIYLDPIDDRLLFWAFPQEAKTNMSAREVDNDDKKKQREELPNAAKLIPIGTVHHHCSAGAFQSSTDLADEKDVDGLHMTIGKMADARYDIHYRFYRSGWEIPVNLTMFWDIGEQIAELVPQDHWNAVAKHQMCTKIPVDFPEQWKNNLIEIKPTYHNSGATGSVYQGGLGYQNPATATTFWERKDNAAIETIYDWFIMKMEYHDMLAMARFLIGSASVNKLRINCNICNVQIDDVCREIVDTLEKPDYLVRRLAKRGMTIDNPVKLSKKDKKQKMLELKDKIASAAEEATKAGSNGGNGVGTGKPEVSSGVTGRRWWNANKQCYMDEHGNPVEVGNDDPQNWDGYGA